MTLTTKELASPDHLNCHIDTVRRLAKAGIIPAIKVGREYRFDWDDVKAALAPASASDGWDAVRAKLATTPADPWVNPRRRTPRAA